MSALIEAIETQLDRAMLLDNPGDHILMVLSGECRFITGDGGDGQIQIIVPHSDDFYAEKINLYLGARLLNQASPTGNSTELTFRPANWVSTNNDLAGTSLSTAAQVQDADAVWKMEDNYNGTYQGETGVQMAGAYSAQYGQGNTKYMLPLSAWPGARKFFIPQKLKRGTTVSIGVSPTFSRVANAVIKTQFRVTAVLTGHKVVRRPA